MGTEGAFINVAAKVLIKKIVTGGLVESAFANDLFRKARTKEQV